jgi:PAS domain S-box-containing protein
MSVENQERLAAIAQSATDAFVVIDERQRILLFNPGAELMFGCSEREAVGTHFQRFIPPRFRASYAASFERVCEIHLQARSRTTVPISRGLRTNGEEFPWEASIAQHELSGRPEFTFIIRDITGQKRFEEALVRRVAFEAFLFELSSTFLGFSEEDVDANMQLGLARVGGFLNMDRVTLLELSRDREEMTVAYSWTAPGVANPPHVLTKEMQPWWIRQVLRGDVSLVSRVDDLPEEATSEKEYLRQRNVASIASIPLRVGGEIAGAISFVTVRRQVSWASEIVNQLRAIGDILWNALKRRQSMQALMAAQNLLLDSEERFRLITNTAPVMIWMTGADGQCTYVNQRWLDFTGRPLDSELGRGWAEGIQPEDRKRVAEITAEAFYRREAFEVEYRMRAREGNYRWIFVQGVPRFDANRSLAGYIGSAVDMTERKAAEEALSALSRRVIDAQEQERARVARELHDDINQQVALLALNLEGVKQRFEGSVPEVADPLGKLAEAAVTLVTDIQSLSHRLHAPKLNILGLEAAAHDLCHELSDHGNVGVRFRSDGVLADLSEELYVCLYRVLQEAVQNAIKHSGSQHVDVSLRRSANEVTLLVHDSGIGFEPDEAFKGRGLGLINMKERLRLVGGELTIDSRSQAGTTIQARVPLKCSEGFVIAG